MESRYDLIVLGATFQGIGAAIGASNSLIIERSTSLGWEYIDSFCRGTGWDSPLASEECNRIKTDFLNRGILTQDGLNFAGASHYLNKYILDKGVNLLFMSDVINVTQRGGIYEVEVVNESGRYTINGHEFYDAMPTNDSGEKYLNGLLCCNRAEVVPKSWTADIEIEKYVLPNTALLKVLADDTADMVQARKKMHDIWENRPPELEPWKIGQIAERFEYQKIINPLQAFEIGFRRGE